MIKTQLFSKKHAKYYLDRAVATSGVHTRTETITQTFAKVENLFAHCVATYDIEQSELQTIDGYTVRDGDIVLCANQLIPTRRWLARVNGAGAWTPTNDKVHAGISVAIAYGTVNAGSLYVCQLPDKATEQGLEETVWVKQQPASELQYIWSMVRRLVKATYDKIMCYIEDIRPYEVICHADTLPVPFDVFPLVETTIPFTTVRYSPADGSFSAGQFTAGRSGYYDVDVLLVNEGIAAPAYRINLRISGSLDVYNADTQILGGDNLRLQGSRKVYCEEGGIIEAVVYHTGALLLGLNTVAHPGGYGYISISFAGKTTAATNV